MPEIAESTSVCKSIRVSAPIERAFSVFVEQMETWWPPDHHLGAEPFQSIIIEPRIGGRWYERDASGVEGLWGFVRAWDPPHRVTLSWHIGPNWKYDPDLATASDVELRFTSEGPSATLVELTHSGLERHGEGYQQLREILDGPDAWGRTLQEFAKAVNKETAA